MAAQPTASSSTSTIGDLTLRGMPLWVQDTVATAAAVVTDTVATAAAVVTDATVGRYHTALLVIYVAVLLSGVAGLALALRALRSHALSVTTIAVLNLVFAHFLFLVTLPFRIYYYAADRWPLSAGWCKAVSSMIHIHLYMCFVFYVVILVTRLLSFHRRRGEAATVEFQRRTHAILVSVAVWTVVAVAVPLLVHFCYGNGHRDTDAGGGSGGGGGGGGGGDNREMCFDFGHRIRAGAGVAGLNYAIGAAIIAVSLTLTALQAHVLLLLRRKYGREWRGQQVFWAQLRSLCFAGIMVVCFVPYHMFRMYYITHVDDLQHVNEVFLSVTALSCLDMLTFVGRGTCLCC